MKVRDVLPLFKDEVDTEFPDYIIDNKCHAGTVYPESKDYFSSTEQGQICYETYGAMDTFSIGMPMYNQQGDFIGRLGVGFYKHLDYEKCDELVNKIPSYFWKVIGYEGNKTLRPLTYYQILRQQSKWK